MSLSPSVSLSHGTPLCVHEHMHMCAHVCEHEEQSKPQVKYFPSGAIHLGVLLLLLFSLAGVLTGLKLI